ncbi:MAG: hypothetical protein E7318_13020 [Clostridiales bacterium]|nr:hypothetical protein [Clostridiales bacterium]
MEPRWQRIILTAACIATLALTGLFLTRLTESPLSSLTARDRSFLRIWAVNAPGGGQAWLKAQLRTFEKQHPGVSTYLRTVSATELTTSETILPDVVLYMPGDVTEPSALFLPLTGDMAARDGLLREELLRCGRWQNQQYGLPLCWGAWILAIDSALEPGSATTPAPTTLLGRPAATLDASSTPEPDYPLEAARQADCALQSPGGTALFTLSLLLEEQPPLPAAFATLSSGEVYAAFQRRQCVTAMLTTGQAIAFAGLTSGGSGFPHRIMTADEVITDQVWLASVTADAPPEAALLLSFLASAEAQKALSAQGLHTVRDDLTLYASGISARVESAAHRALSAINAYLPAETVQSAAWQFFHGQITLNEALLPLM